MTKINGADAMLKVIIRLATLIMSTVSQVVHSTQV